MVRGSGVPQGSVLGSLLFILYIDALHHLVTNSTLKIFADDVTVYRIGGKFQWAKVSRFSRFQTQPRKFRR